MALSGPHRRFAFFAVALLLPSLLVAAFGVLLIRQDAELVERRRSDRRALVVRAWSDSLYQRLERAYSSAEPGADRRTKDGQLLMPATFDNGSLRLRGQAPENSPLLDSRFQDFVISTTQLERRDRRPLEAARRFETRRASDPTQRAYLKQMHARALRLAGRTEAAQAVFAEVLATPDSVIAEGGTPLAYYAAVALLADSLLAPVADRLGDLPSGWMPEAAAREALRLREQAGLPPDGSSEQFAREHDLAASLRPSTIVRDPSPAAPRWVVDPSGGWLIRLVDGGRVDPEPVVAIAVDEIPSVAGADSPMSGFRVVGDSQEASLPSPFRGMAADVAVEPANGNARRWLGGSLIVLFLGLALMSGVLLWRDVRRETRLAALRTQFVSSVSHELRTPLTSIRLYAESMRAFGADDPGQRNQDLDVIASESERLTRMLDNVLNTSRIEKGTMRYRMELGDVSEPVERAVRSMRYVFDQADVPLTCASDSVWTMLDPDAVEQAVINLLSNALKYGDATPVAVTCTQVNGHAQVSVSDGGRGLSPEAHHRIFERFYREESAIEQNVPGAGLGLALVRHIAEAHEGEIAVDSEAGAGARFTLSIPVTEA